MAELIATSTSAADSADFTVNAGDSISILLKDGTSATAVTSSATALVQAKSGTQYITIGTVTGSNPLLVLSAPGTFRVSKLASAVAFGVDKN